LDSPQAVLIPGGLRWRSLVPLEDRNGLCEVVYDLERNILVEVPDVFQYYIAMALECGNPDETLLGWLAAEDLLTYDHPPLSEASDSSSMVEMSEMSRGLGCVVFVEDRAHCRLTGGLDRTALDTLDCLLGPRDGVPRLTLHLDGEGGRLSFEELQRIVETTRASTEATGREISYELRIDAESANAEVASFLARHPFRVRVRCDGPPQPPEMLHALGLLRDHLGDNLTVHSVLRSDRLLDLWHWARELGLGQLHVTRLSPRADQEESRAAQLRSFRNNLEEICDDMLEGLQTEDRRTPLYEPISRVVRRLAHHHRKVSRAGSPCLGVISHGRVFPVSPAAGPPAGYVSASAGGWDGDDHGEEKTTSHPCHGCSARRLCGRGLAADPALSGIERVDIWGRHCDFWRAEVEVGLLFYRRLKSIDPEYLLGLGTSASDAFLDPPDGAAGVFEWKTC